MAAEPTEIRRKTRRLKDLALDQAIDVLENRSKHTEEVYKETYLTVLKNSVPRTQEITGEDGQALQVNIIKYGGDTTTPPVPTERISDTPPSSV